MSLKNCLTKSNGDNTVDSVTKEDGGVNTMDNVTIKVVVKPEARCDQFKGWRKSKACMVCIQKVVWRLVVNKGHGKIIKDGGNYNAVNEMDQIIIKHGVTTMFCNITKSQDYNMMWPQRMGYRMAWHHRRARPQGIGWLKSKVGWLSFEWPKCDRMWALRF